MQQKTSDDDNVLLSNFASSYVMCGLCMRVVFIDRGLMCIHPSFRIVALAEPPVVGSTSQQWLNAEQLATFLYHNMRSLSVSEELHVLSKLVSWSVSTCLLLLTMLNC